MKIVDIKRSGTFDFPQFVVGEFPQEFQGKIDPKQFEAIVTEINSILANAYRPHLLRSIISSVLFSMRVRLSPVKDNDIDSVVARLNRELLSDSRSNGVEIVSPTKTGFLCLRFKYAF